jgi:hypothetical protein
MPYVVYDYTYLFRVAFFAIGYLGIGILWVLNFVYELWQESCTRISERFGCGCACPSISDCSSFTFNFMCFLWHGIWGVWLFIDSMIELNVGGFTTSMPIYYLRMNSSAWPVVHYYTEHVCNFNIVLMLSVFSIVTSLTHFWYAMTMDDNNQYSPSYDYRYFEYALTAPIMYCVIMLLFGMREIFLLIATFVLMMSTMFFGVLQSWQSDSVAPHLFGWIPYLVTWFGILLPNTIFVVNDNVDVPVYVWIAYGIEFFLFSLFGFVQMTYDVYPKYKRQEPLNNEINKRADGFNNLLSLLSKALLVMILYFNFIQLESV